jgi:hypothetical protein
MTTTTMPPRPQRLGDAPDWTTFERELRCPLCGYNLRGLVEPRCPECGYGFTWAELCEHDETHHPYLFEHNPRRNVRSFLQTFAAGWLPWRFWRRLTARHEIDSGRLKGYYFTSLFAAPLLAFMAMFLWALAVTIDQNAAAATAARYAVSVGNPRYMVKEGRYFEDISGGWSTPPIWHLVNPPWTSAAFLGQVSDRLDFDRGWPCFGIISAAFFWQWLTFATLMIFRRSMRRSAVKTAHVTRCIIYGFDFVPLLALAAIVWPPQLHYFRWNTFAGQVVGMTIVLLPIGWFRLGCAYRYYLRFPHAFATALASQLIVFLLVLAWAGNVRL